jgi:hypothetical protein
MSAVLRLVIAFLLAAPPAARAGLPIPPILNLSGDLTASFGDPAVTTNDEDVFTDDGTGGISRVNLGSLPAATDVIAHHQYADRRHLLAFDTTVALPGFVTARRGDVVVFDGTTYAIQFNAAAAGLPMGITTDAVTTIAGGDLLLSFDTSVEIGGVRADDEDLVRVGPAGVRLFFDGSAAGVPTRLDLDAAHHVDRTGHLLLSFDAGGTTEDSDVPVTFDDDDILEYAPETGVWTLVSDGRLRSSLWLEGDVDAVSVPLVCLLDVDGNRRVDVATDVVYVARHLLRLSPVPPSFRSNDPTIPPDATIAANVDRIGAELDVDNSGAVEVATDVVYVARHLLNLGAVPPSFRVGDPTIPSDEVVGVAAVGLCAVDATPPAGISASR